MRYLGTPHNRCATKSQEIILFSYTMKLHALFNKIDPIIVHWMTKHGQHFLRYSIAIVFIWFGGLKVLGVSPAADLVMKTTYFVDPSWFFPVLAWWEVIIGLCFLWRPAIRVGILLLLPHMVGTFMPMLLLPEVVYQSKNLLYLTMEGQYIVKNLLIIGSAIVIGSHVRRKND